MSDKSAIEWTDATWNPVTGCTKVSPGCDNCYAERLTERFHGKGSFEVVTLRPGRMDQPLRWRRPRRIFVNSMSDLFHDAVPDDYIAQVFDVMARAPQHQFQILTKRHGRMRSLVRSWLSDNLRLPLPPLPNVWLGVSVEDQRWADIRVPALLETPAAVRFLSCEPLIGPLDLTEWLHESSCVIRSEDVCTCYPPYEARVNWVIVGGESGSVRRTMHPQWVRNIRGQCAQAGVPFLFKQWGGPTAKSGGRELDGRTWDEYPKEAVRA